MRITRLQRWICLLALGLACLAGSLAAQDDAAQPPPSGTVDSTYQLGPGDKVRINVFNHADLSGEYTLDGNGRFSMPLIGTVDAGGLTPTELEAMLVGRFRPDYLVNPRIFIQVGNYRPYYLLGEVASKGAFPYKPGLTYLTAIAEAGGYTYRAKQDFVFVIRGDDPTQTEIKLSVEERVLPGDIIRVAERLF
jgi:protein involved in polysaccharide export with SLBB domain